jgi:acylphosphatase
VSTATVDEMAERPYDEATVRKRIVAHGRVQGVFFRDSVRRRAQARGVSGWVRNCADGTVEAAFEGPASAVDELIRFAGAGPPGAEVESLDRYDEAVEGLTGFQVR